MRSWMSRIADTLCLKARPDFRHGDMPEELYIECHVCQQWTQRHGTAMASYSDQV